MTTKNVEKRRAAWRRYYHKNKSRLRSKMNVLREARRQTVLAWVNSIKERTPCADCHKKFPAICMDFDHIKNDKEENVAALVARGISIKRIEKEIAKCEVVCSNCHRLRTQCRYESMVLIA